MKRRVISLILGVAILTICWYLNSWGGSSCKDIPGLLLVKFKPGVLIDYGLKKTGMALTGIASVDQLNQRYNAKDIRKVFPGETSPLPPGSELLDLSGFYEIEFPEESDLQELISVYSQDPNLEIVERVQACPLHPENNDPDNQWHLDNALMNDADVDAYEAWDIGTGDSSIILAILDTGVGYYCPDLSWNIWTNPGEIPGNGIDDDLNGYVDDILGWDFVTGGYLCDYGGGEDCSIADNNPGDFDGHGTHVAGIAAAVTNNNTGGAGLAGGWYPDKKGCKIMVLRVGWHASNGLGYVSMNNVASAINYARHKGATAVNCSWGSSYNSALYSAMTDALSEGMVFCKSAGNDDTDFWDDFLIDMFSDVIAIASTDRYDQKSSFSNYGTKIDISAPGSQIRSTYGYNYGCTYATMGGTSMAAPMVTGMVGLLRSKIPELSIAEVTSLIEDYADSIDHLNPGYEGKLGAGRISLYNPLVLLPNAKFSADLTLGQAPLTVQFTDSSSGDGLYNWKWVFGDGDSVIYDTSANPSHTYEPGFYTCSYSVSGTWGTNTQNMLIGATSDTVRLSYSEGLALEYGVKVPVYANNYVTCSQLVIAMRYGYGSAPLKCDSVRFWGTRVEDFSIKNVSIHKTNQTILLTLRDNNNPLQPGSGLLANMYFTLDSAVSIGDTLEVDTAIIGSSYLNYTSILGDYVPHFQVGGIYIVEPLCGDADRNGNLTVADVIFLVNYLFKGGPAPNPLYIGNCDCDGAITVSDAICLINYLFKGGPPPDCNC